MTRHRPRSLELTELADEYAVCRLPPDAPVPAWADRAAGDFTTVDFTTVSRSQEELSITCPARGVPPDVRTEAPWTCFKVAGPLDFDEIGIVASLAAPLAMAGIGIFIVSTFDTDYLLVSSAARERAVSALLDAGHSVVGIDGERTAS